MQASPQAARSPRTGARAQLASLILPVGIALFALYHLGLAIFMAAAPRAFFDAIGPFGTLNEHYLRDLATYNAALAAGLLTATRRAAWRVPMLAITAIQFALHSVNHLVDIGAADPRWTGYFDFFSLAAATVLLLWLLQLARVQARTFASDSQGDQP